MKILNIVCLALLVGCSGGLGISNQTLPSTDSESQDEIGTIPQQPQDEVSSPKPVVYGAKADQGETDDPLVDNVTYAGQVYYIDCENGSDANNGLSHATAWKTLQQASTKFLVGYWDTVAANANTNPQFHQPWVSASTGSAFLFKRGCVFDGFIRVSAYVLNPLGGSGWFNDKFTFGAYGDRSLPRPQIMYVTAKANFYGNIIDANSKEIYIRNLHLVGNVSQPSTGIWVNNAPNVIIENVTIENMQRDGITADNARNLVIKNSIIHNNQLGGGRGGGLAGGGPNMQILNSTFSYNGRDQIGAHNIYLRELDSATIRNNSITKGSNMGLVIHGINHNVLITENDIYENNNGLSVSSGYYSGEVEVQDNITISKNLIRQNGFGANEQGYAMLLDTITNTTVVNNVSFGNRLGGVSISDGPAKDVPSQNVKVYHNLFYESKWYSLQILGSRTVAVDIKNNIFANQSATEVALYINGINLSEITSDYNFYYAPHVSKEIKIGTTSYSKSEIATNFGFEVNGFSGNPLFIGESQNNFKLQDTSAAKNSGKSGYVGVDFIGLVRSNTSPNIGPFE